MKEPRLVVRCCGIVDWAAHLEPYARIVCKLFCLEFGTVVLTVPTFSAFKSLRMYIPDMFPQESHIHNNIERPDGVVPCGHCEGFLLLQFKFSKFRR